ncbi:MAG: carboxypeptidase regulatory-like domain-containing protein, partial [Acidobacteria bacterium]|nr:carboxypeptidase regulatory-like domain-containing protein [Acidobacteriota bacterium]
MSRPWQFLAILLVLVTFVVPVAGQTTFATITGTITDQTGAPVPGASVAAVHRDSNYRYTTESNAVGAYTLGRLLEGSYTVRVTLTGFKEFVASDVQLVSLDVRRIDVRLEVGSVDTRIEVTAGATLIETETARISDSKAARQLATLPLNTRSLWNFVGLSPGVVQAGGGS